MFKTRTSPDRRVLARLNRRGCETIRISFGLKPAARLHPVEIAVDVKLQKNRGVVRRPACRGRLDAFEAGIGQIEPVDKAIHHTNGIALLDPTHGGILAPTSIVRDRHLQRSAS